MKPKRNMCEEMRVEPLWQSIVFLLGLCGVVCALTLCCVGWGIPWN